PGLTPQKPTKTRGRNSNPELNPHEHNCRRPLTKASRPLQVERLQECRKGPDHKREPDLLASFAATVGEKQRQRLSRQITNPDLGRLCAPRFWGCESLQLMR